MNKVVRGVPCENCVECIIDEYTLSAVQIKKVGPEMFEITDCELQNYGEKGKYMKKNKEKFTHE